MSFEEIYTTHYRKLVGFAFQYTQSVDDSEDVVQESFTRFWKEVQHGTEIQNAQAWLFKVMINLLKTKKSAERLRNGKENGHETKELQSDDFQAEYFLNERKKIISKELNLLPENEKSLLILYHRGLKYEEIAQILDMKQSSVGTTLARVITKFRNTLKAKHHELFE